MEKKKIDVGTYITSFNSNSKKENIKSTLFNRNNQNSLSKKNIFNTIESNSILNNKKLKQIIFPLIKSTSKNIYSIISEKNNKSTNKIQKKNLLDNSSKNNRNSNNNMKSKNRNNKKNKYLPKYFNSHSFDKIIRKQKSNKTNKNFL